MTKDHLNMPRFLMPSEGPEGHLTLLKEHTRNFRRIFRFFLLGFCEKQRELGQRCTRLFGNEMTVDSTGLSLSE